MEHFTGKRGGKDPLGSVVNAETHRINIAMTADPQTLQQVSVRSRVPNIPRVREHMRWLVEKGFAERHGRDRWMLNRCGLELLNGHLLSQTTAPPVAAADVDPPPADRVQTTVSRIIRDRLTSVIRSLATEKQAELDRHKERARDRDRPDFLWHILLESFATLGAAAGYDGLIGNRANYDRLTYEALTAIDEQDREAQIRAVCRDAQQQGLRYPERKADFIRACFEQIKSLGGPVAARNMLLEQCGRPDKIRFLKQFKGIGDKYARNIMMIVYDEDFRDSIAVDSRIKSVTAALGLSFSSYDTHEAFYLDVARQAGINGWELDRLVFWFKDDVLARLRVPMIECGEAISFEGTRMNTTVEQVLDAALALPDGERVEIVEALIASFQPEDRPFDESWREVIQRRSAELRSGLVTPVPWAEVKNGAREKAGG